MQACWEHEHNAAIKEQAKRQEAVIKRWTRLVQGLRIRQRLQEQYADRGDDQGLSKNIEVTVQTTGPVCRRQSAFLAICSPGFTIAFSDFPGRSSVGRLPHDSGRRRAASLSAQIPAPDPRLCPGRSGGTSRSSAWFQHRAVSFVERSRVAIARNGDRRRQR